jgi:hypothetical protein
VLAQLLADQAAVGGDVQPETMLLTSDTSRPDEIVSLGEEASIAAWMDSPARRCDGGVGGRAPNMAMREREEWRSFTLILLGIDVRSGLPVKRGRSGNFA